MACQKKKSSFKENTIPKSAKDATKFPTQNSKIETAIPGMINFLHVSAADYQCLFLCGPQELLLHA